MNYVDLILIIILGYGVWWGFRKGLIKAVAGFLAAGISIFLGFKFHDFLLPYVEAMDFIPKEFLPVASMIATMILIYIGLKIAIRIMDRMIKAIGLGFINRLVGGLLGLMMNVLILSAFSVYVLPYFDEVSTSEAFLESKIWPVLNDIAETLKFGIHQLTENYQGDII